MHKPTQQHMIALKHVLRYLNRTHDSGIRVVKTNEMKLCVFTDSDWVEEKDDRTSTSAYVIYIGKTPIFWSSKM